MSRPEPSLAQLPCYPEGQTPCEHPGCMGEAHFSVDNILLCWDHMVPLRDAGKDVYAVLKSERRP